MGFFKSLAGGIANAVGDVAAYEGQMRRIEEKARKELDGGANRFEIEVLASDFPNGKDEDFDDVPRLVEHGLPGRLPVKVVGVKHAPGEDRAVFTLERRSPDEPYEPPAFGHGLA